MTRIELRPLARADRAAIEAIVRGVDRFPDAEIAIAMELVDHALDRGGDDYLFVVAERDGTLAGYACWGRATMSPAVFDLYWIVVDASLHGGGVGQALLAHAERAVRSADGHTLLIETEGSPPYEASRRFYLRAGYAEVGRVADFYGAGKDKVLFAKRLEPSAS
jgi:GNAT superfamily N-acetyltransferase